MDSHRVVDELLLESSDIVIPFGRGFIQGFHIVHMPIVLQLAKIRANIVGTTCIHPLEGKVVVQHTRMTSAMEALDGHGGI